MTEDLNAFPLGADFPDGLLVNFLRTEMTPLALQLAEFLIESDRLEKNDLLLECALRLANEWDLYACAIALRNGASPGIYVVETRKSLVVTILEKNADISEDTLAWRLLSVFALSGLDQNKAAFLDEESPTIKEYCLRVLPEGLQLPVSAGAVRVRDRFYILSLAGKEKELPDRKLTESEVRFCIKARCLREEADLSAVTARSQSDSLIAVLSLEYHNEKAFLIYLKKGGLPSYALMNRLCLLASSKNVSGYLWEKVVVEAVSRGTRMDEHQYLICKRKNALAKQVKAAYEVPYWKKFFHDRINAESIPNRIDDCMVALVGRDYDLSLQIMREVIANYVKASRNEKQRLLGEERLMPIYYVEYSYQGVTHRIDSPHYHHLEKMPDYELLPEHAREKIMKKVQSRIHLIRSRQLSTTQPKTRESVINEIIRNDSISDEETESKVAFYYSLFRRAPELNDVLDEIYEAELTTDHRRATIAHVFTDRRYSPKLGSA